MVKFVHTADWQLGMTRHFLNDEAQARFSGARIDVIRRVGALAVEEGCEFVVVLEDSEPVEVAPGRYAHVGNAEVVALPN